MKVALFVPCYVDQFYPQAAIAALELLEKLGIEVLYPQSQTCCGQPMANSGYENLSKPVEKNFSNAFKDHDYIVGLSGSCVLHVKEHFTLKPDWTENIYEICDFIHRFCDYKSLKSYYPHKVVIHQGCHGLRGLRLSKSSERVEAYYSVPDDLLSVVDGLELVNAARPDECCGFGGTFCITEEAVSVRMGADKVNDFLKTGAGIMASTDLSCLMHLEGLARRQNLPLQAKHIVEILNAD